MTTPRIPTKLYKYRGNHRPKYCTNPKHVYFRDVKPLALKDQLTGRDSSGKQTACVGQLLEMLDCLKRTGFIDGPCQQQIAAFKKCYAESRTIEMVKQARGDNDISLIQNTRDMKQEQLNVLLKRFHTKT